MSISGCQVIELNEDNIYVNLAPEFIRKAYEQGKWAFVADWAKLTRCWNSGGFVCDADVEFIKPIPEYMFSYHFISGQEINEKVFPTALWGGVPLNLYCKLFLQYYDVAEFNTKPNTYYMTKFLEPFIKSKVNGNLHLYHNGILMDQNYFCPYNHRTRTPLPREETVCIHHFQGSWK